MGRISSYSFRLFKQRPSFVGGISVLVDHSPIEKRYNVDATEKEADRNSLCADWFAVGEDMQKAIDIYASTESK